MTEPASSASESSKAVPVGEPPTPEGWPRTIEVCPVCGEVMAATLGAEPFFCAGTFAEQHERTQSMLVRVAPVGGTGVRPEDARLILSAHRKQLQGGISTPTDEEREAVASLARLAASVGEGDEDG